METRDSDAETYETIPWAQLAPSGRPVSTRLATVVVGVLVAAVAAYVLAAVLRPGPSGVVVDLSRSGAVAEPNAPLTTERPTTTAVPASSNAPALEEAGAPVSTPSGLFSEADLMAIATEEEMRAAVVRAEWFVVDFFTVDGDPASGDGVRDALPVGMDVSLPHDAAAGVSYVEWARATAVRLDDSGTYVVDVAFRTLAGPSGSDLARMPVRVVRMPIRIDDNGLPFVVDLPQAVAVAGGQGVFAAPSPAEPPDDVAAAAAAAAAAIGTPGPPAHAGLDADGWRIVVGVTDDSGLTWPVVARP